VTKYKTAKISDLIKLLSNAMEEYGNIPVVLASDSEINSVGTINVDDDLNENLTEENGVAILFPHAEGLYLDDIQGYESEEDEAYDDFDDTEDTVYDDDNYYDEDE